MTQSKKKLDKILKILIKKYISQVKSITPKLLNTVKLYFLFSGRDRLNQGQEGIRLCDEGLGLAGGLELIGGPGGGVLRDKLVDLDSSSSSSSPSSIEG